MILNYLKNISIVLDKDLNNAKEKFGGFIKKYGIAVGLGVLNIDLTKIGETLSDTELEKLKDRVNAFLKESKNLDSRGWLLDIMKCIEKMDKKDFSLSEIYQFENYLGLQHPNNNNIQAKIR